MTIDRNYVILAVLMYSNRFYAAMRWESKFLVGGADRKPYINMWVNYANSGAHNEVIFHIWLQCLLDLFDENYHKGEFHVVWHNLFKKNSEKFFTKLHDLANFWKKDGHSHETLWYHILAWLCNSLTPNFNMSLLFGGYDFDYEWDIYAWWLDVLIVWWRLIFLGWCSCRHCYHLD